MATFLAKSVLVVDDDPITIRIVRTLLSRIGFKHVDDAPNGLDALVKMSENKYDLLIADWNMEPMNGYELLKQVRSDRRFARTSLMMMTSGSKLEHVIAAKKAGASSYIRKPFDAETLKAKIDTSFLGLSLFRQVSL